MTPAGSATGVHQQFDFATYWECKKLRDSYQSAIDSARMQKTHLPFDEFCNHIPRLQEIIGTARSELIAFIRQHPELNEIEPKEYVIDPNPCIDDGGCNIS